MNKGTVFNIQKIKEVIEMAKIYHPNYSVF